MALTDINFESRQSSLYHLIIYLLFILGAESKEADTSGESEGLAVSKEQVTNIKSVDDKTGTYGFALDAPHEQRHQ